MAGIDEAGRGPWAGPVVAAAVVLPSSFDLPQLNDSKRLSPALRETLYHQILSQALDSSIIVSDPLTIDRHNILKATQWAMAQAAAKLLVSVRLVLVDGYPLPASLVQGRPWRQKGVVGGDGKSAAVAAASILAKVTRDRIMVLWDAAYPMYGFARHKGYGTPQHQEALGRFGPCPLHRFSFKPVRGCAG